jgi:hypothetical protein
LNLVRRFYAGLAAAHVLVFLSGMGILAASHGLLHDSGTLDAVGLLVSAVGAPGIPMVAMLVWLRRHVAPQRPVAPAYRGTPTTRALGFAMGIGHVLAIFGSVWLIYTLIPG